MKRDRHLLDIWQKEQNEAADREQARWKGIQAKQQLCRALHKQIAEENATLSPLEYDLKVLEAKPRSYDKWRRVHGENQWQYARDDHYEARQSLKSKIDSICSRIASLKQQLAAAQKPPPVLYQLLAQDQRHGPRGVFFAHMPERMRHLSKLSYEACEVFMNSLNMHESTSWPSEIEQEVPSQHCLFKTGIYDLFSAREAVETPIGYYTPVLPEPKEVWSVSNVEYIRSSSEGVWHATEFEPQTIFPNRRNPWFLPSSMLVRAFTERLPSSGGKKLQWALEQPGFASVALDRGNIGIANQSDQPTWMNKPQYLAFTMLRAFPLQQIRQLLASLHDDLLQLTHPAVHMLVQMAAYHVGTLTPRVDGQQTLQPAGVDSNGHGVVMDWKHDLLSGDGLDVFATELESLATDLANTPRRHEALLLLGPLAAFLAGFEFAGMHGSAAR